MDSDPNRVCLHVDQIIKAHLNKSSEWKQECVSADLCSHIYSLALNQLFSLFSVGPLFILQLKEKRNSMFISFKGSFSVSDVITIHERLNYWTSILTVRPQDDEEAKIKLKTKLFLIKTKNHQLMWTWSSGVFTSIPLCFLVTLRAGRGCGPPTPTPPSLPVLGSSFVHCSLC